MDTVFILEHFYEVDEVDEIKFIGVFSSNAKAELAIEDLIIKQGFKDHPKEAFQISKVELDNYEWKDGFCSWEEAIES